MIRYSNSWVHNFQTSQWLRFLNLAPPVKHHFHKIEEVLNGYVTNPNPTPTLTPNHNPNQINKKI